MEESLLPKLISFDIDGTLEVGEPPGCITMDMVRAARSLGCFIGSCSDRTISNQQLLWKAHNIPVDFTVLKQDLDTVKQRFHATEYYHVGDSYLDELYSGKSGFLYLPPEPGASMLMELFGGPPQG